MQQPPASDSSPDQRLLNLVGNEDAAPARRMSGLHWLCESYFEDERLWPIVAKGLRKTEFQEFPLLGHFSIPSTRVLETCELAEELLGLASINGRASLTDPRVRAAGKLLEHLCQKPARVLQPHVDRIEKTVGLSKIFFRVNLEELKTRSEYLELDAEQLSAQLDEAFKVLATKDSEQHFQIAQLSLEALRANYPDRLDLVKSIRRKPPESGPAAVSFQLTMKCLLSQPEEGSEPILAGHLADEREAIHGIATEALVRTRSAQAARCFLEVLDQIEAGPQRWVARGLQRVRVEGIRIARLRNLFPPGSVLWRMLLIAELRQLDPESQKRLGREIQLLAEMPQDIHLAADIYLAATHGESDDFAKVFAEHLKYLEANTKKTEQTAKRNKLRSALKRIDRDHLN